MTGAPAPAGCRRGVPYAWTNGQRRNWRRISRLVSRATKVAARKARLAASALVVHRPCVRLRLLTFPAAPRQSSGSTCTDVDIRRAPSHTELWRDELGALPPRSGGSELLLVLPPLSFLFLTAAFDPKALFFLSFRLRGTSLRVLNLRAPCTLGCKESLLFKTLLLDALHVAERNALLLRAPVL